MKTVADRIEQAPACTVINLDDVEKNLYTGAGWKLARFVDGTLVEIFDPLLLNFDSDADTEEMATTALRTATLWLNNIESGNAARSCTNGVRDGGEAWLVLCSGYQLCEPRRVTPNTVAALAYMARVFAEQFETMN